MEDALRKAAMAAGELATRREVAAWVGDAFREEIAERRDAIRAALNGGHDRKPSRLPGTRPTLDLGAFTPSGVSEAAATPVALIQPTASISLDTQVDPATAATAATQPVPRVSRTVDTQTKTPTSLPAAMMQAPKPSRAPWLALAVALPVLGGGGYFAYRAMQTNSIAPAPVAAAQPLPAAAVPQPAAPKEPAKIDVGIDSDTPGARVVFRRRIASAPMTTNIAPSDIVELVEVSAPGYKTERYWLTFDRATHLHAHLAKGNGIEEASEEQTLVALGEQPAIEEARPAAAAVHVTEKTVAQVAPAAPAAAVVAQSTPRRRIGRAAADDTTVATERVEQRAHVAMEAPALASAPTAVAAPALPEPSPALAVPTPAPVVAVAQPAVRPAPVAVSAKVVAPAQFRALIASNGQIEPSELVQSQMMRDEKKKAGAFVKVCIGTAGEVTSASIVKSSGYPDYDAELVAGVRGWHFHAYTEGGRATPACSAVVFSFTLK
jgi:protein TonB